MANKNVRLASTIFSSSKGAPSANLIKSKIIEAVILDANNKKMSINEVVSNCQNNYHLTFSYEEILTLLTSDKRNKFEIYDEDSDKIKVRLQDRRYKLLISRAEKSGIEFYVKEFKSEFKGSLDKDIDVENILYKYFLELLDSNITAFKRLLEPSHKSKDPINVTLEDFDDKERKVINLFLNWDNRAKDQMIFDIVNYSIEYSLISTKRNPETLINALRNKKLYLDTNVIFRILGINGESRLQRTKNFLSSCLNKDFELWISKYSEDEFKNAVKQIIQGFSKFSSNKISPQIVEQYFGDGNFYAYYLKWRGSKRVANFDLFKSYVYSQYDLALKNYNIKVDYKTPKDGDEEFIENKTKYFDDIVAYKTRSAFHSLGSSGAQKSIDRTAEFDSSNIAYIERLRGENCREISDTKYFLVSNDQNLRKWDFERDIAVPVVMLPSQWSSLLFKYFPRSKDDLRSFKKYLNLRVDEHAIPDEKIYAIISGIADITESIENQEIIVDQIINVQFKKEIKDLSDEELYKKSQEVATKLMDKEVKYLKEAKLNLLDELNKSKEVNSEILTKMDELANKSKWGAKQIVQGIVNRDYTKWRVKQFVLWSALTLVIVFIFLYGIFGQDDGANIIRSLYSWIDTLPELPKSVLIVVFSAIFLTSPCLIIKYKLFKLFRKVDVQAKKQSMKLKVMKDLNLKENDLLDFKES